eukprot:scaffold470490_cov42-Prasinocladus_malaysianus.AAC.1
MEKRGYVSKEPGSKKTSQPCDEVVFGASQNDRAPEAPQQRLSEVLKEIPDEDHEETDPKKKGVAEKGTDHGAEDPSVLIVDVLDWCCSILTGEWLQQSFSI